MEGMPLTRLVEARLDAEVADAAVDGVLERTSDALEDLFCRAGLCCGVGRDSDDADGFLRSCSLAEAEMLDGWRSCDRLLDGLSTGSLEAGLGIPEGRGMDVGWSMAMPNALSEAATPRLACVSSGVRMPAACPMVSPRLEAPVKQPELILAQGLAAVER